MSAGVKSAFSWAQLGTVLGGITLRLALPVGLACLGAGCLTSLHVPKGPPPSAERLLVPSATLSLPGGVDSATSVSSLDEERGLALVQSEQKAWIVDVTGRRVFASLELASPSDRVLLGQDDNLYVLSQAERTVSCYQPATHSWRWHTSLKSTVPPGQSRPAGADGPEYDLPGGYYRLREAPRSGGGSGLIGVLGAAIADAVAPEFAIERELEAPSLALSPDHAQVVLLGGAPLPEAGTGVFNEPKHENVFLVLEASNGRILRSGALAFRDRLADGSNVLVDLAAGRISLSDDTLTARATIPITSDDLPTLKDAEPFSGANGFQDLPWDSFLSTHRDGNVLSLITWLKSSDAVRSRLIQYNIDTGQRLLSSAQFPATSFTFNVSRGSGRTLLAAVRKAQSGDQIVLSGFIDWRADGTWAAIPLPASLGGAVPFESAKQFHERDGKVFFAGDLSGQTAQIFSLDIARLTFQKAAEFVARDARVAFGGPFAFVSYGPEGRLSMIDLRSGKVLSTSAGYALLSAEQSLDAQRVAVVASNANTERSWLAILKASDGAAVLSESGPGRIALVGGIDALRDTLALVKQEPNGDRNLDLV
ncbi:MAG TPA: hypothetical protein VGL19_12060, partial [Polyangiaceae bacterium]